MMNLNFSVDLFSYLLNFFKGFVCICLFTLSYNKRKYFWLRITACILSGLLLCFLFTLWKLPYDAETTPIAIFTRIFTFLLLNLFLFGIILFCYEENYSESILCWCMAVAVSQATGKIFSVILNACGIDDTKTISFFNNKSPFWLDIGILILFHLIVFGTVAALFARRRKLQTESRTTIFVTLVATFSIIVIYVLGSFSRIYEDMTLNPGLTIVSKLFMIVCNISVISLTLGVLR